MPVLSIIGCNLQVDILICIGVAHTGGSDSNRYIEHFWGLKLI